MLYQALNRDVFGLKKSGPPTNASGIEIEMELSSTVDTNQLRQKYPLWHVKSDGSLRNFGLEFVSDPVEGKDLDDLLSMWDDLLHKDGSLKTRIDGCPRASIHVHKNMRNYTYNQLMNVILAYTILEGIMVTFCGKYRKGNLFALRIPEAPYNFDTLRKAVKSYDIFNLSGDLRYSALNLCSLRTFGTLEFRSMGANYEPDAIRLWIDGLDRLITHAAGFTNPPAVYARYVRLTKPEFIKEFLGPLGVEILKRHSDEVESRLYDGEEYAIALLSSHPDNWQYSGDFRDTEGFKEFFNKNFGGNPLWANSNNFASFVQSQKKEPLVFDPDNGFEPERPREARLGIILPAEAFQIPDDGARYLGLREGRILEMVDAGGVLEDFEEASVYGAVLDRWALSPNRTNPETGQTWLTYVQEVGREYRRRPIPIARPRAPTATIIDDFGNISINPSWVGELSTTFSQAARPRPRRR